MLPSPACWSLDWRSPEPQLLEPPNPQATLIEPSELTLGRPKSPTEVNVAHEVAVEDRVTSLPSSNSPALSSSPSSSSSPTPPNVFDSMHIGAGSDMAHAGFRRMVDRLIDGPRYANGVSPTAFPILRRLQSEIEEHPGEALRWTLEDNGEIERNQVRALTDILLPLAGVRRPRNTLQGEMVLISIYLVRLAPYIVRAIVRSDMTRLMELVETVRALMAALEGLIEVEKEARGRVNEMIREG